MLTVLAFGMIFFALLVQFIVIDNRLTKIENQLNEMERIAEENN